MCVSSGLTGRQRDRDQGEVVITKILHIDKPPRRPSPDLGARGGDVSAQVQGVASARGVPSTTSLEGVCRVDRVGPGGACHTQPSAAVIKVLNESLHRRLASDPAKIERVAYFGVHRIEPIALSEFEQTSPVQVGGAAAHSRWDRGRT